MTQTMDIQNRLQIQNILYATDLSIEAERVLPYAVQLASRYSSTVYAVHVIQPELYPFMSSDTWATVVEQERVFRDESMKELDAELSSVRHELIFREGRVWDVICDVIREKEIQLIVLSTHGRTGMDRALVGSVAEEIFRKAPCPVLTVGPNGSPRQKGRVGRILYATDFTVQSMTGAPYAVSLAQEYRADLVLLHCIEQNGNNVEAMRRSLADLVPFGAELIRRPLCVVERGRASTKILEVAESHGVDLIVLGIHGVENGHVQRQRFSKPGVFNIVRTSKCPVFTVRG